MHARGSQLAQISFVIDDAKAASIIAAIDLLYGKDVAGLTNRQKFVYHLRQTLKRPLIQIRRAAINLSAETQARLDAEAALAAERNARQSAEAVADASAQTDVEGVS